MKANQTKQKKNSTMMADHFEPFYEHFTGNFPNKID